MIHDTLLVCAGSAGTLFAAFICYLLRHDDPSHRTALHFTDHVHPMHRKKRNDER